MKKFNNVLYGQEYCLNDMLYIKKVYQIDNMK